MQGALPSALAGRRWARCSACCDAIPGAEVVDLDAGCCGMAGSFGYETEHYEVSRLVGEQRLFPAVRQAGPDDVDRRPRLLLPAADRSTSPAARRFIRPCSCARYLDDSRGASPAPSIGIGQCHRGEGGGGVSWEFPGFVGVGIARFVNRVARPRARLRLLVPLQPGQALLELGLVLGGNAGLFERIDDEPGGITIG